MGKRKSEDNKDLEGQLQIDQIFKRSNRLNRSPTRPESENQVVKPKTTEPISSPLITPKAIVTQNSTSEMDEIKTMFMDLSTGQAEIKTSQAEIKNLIDRQGVKLIDMEKDVNVLNEKYQRIEERQTQLEVKFSKEWLVITGLLDEKENDDFTYLNDKLTKFFADILELPDIKICEAFPMGKFRDGSTRLIKIRFESTRQRNLIWEKRMNTPMGTYINEDLPKELRIKHGILRRSRREAVAAGKEVVIDWQNCALIMESKRFKISNDHKIVEEKNTGTQGS
jgi:hypothetical protein